MKAAAIYARVSTEEQVANTSLKGQSDACREHAQQHGYTVIREIQEDWSGARLDRPGLDELRAMIDRGELQALVVFEPDRLSRKVAHLLLLEEELTRRGASLLFVKGQDDRTSPEGRMFFTMKGAFGEYERTVITERLRLGKMRLAREGKIIGSRCVPFGYKLANGQYEIVPEEARVARQIFELLVNEGMTLFQIAVKLTQMGIPTKQGSTRWIPSSLKAILNNKTYAGTYYWNKTMPVLPKSRRTEGPHKLEKTSKQRRDPSEWIAIPCPAIVSEELWEAAQHQLQLNRERSPRNSKRRYLLKGMIKCDLCGYSFFGHAATPSRVYYMCGGKTNKEVYRANYTGELCPQKYLRADGDKGVEERVWRYIAEQTSDEEALLATFAQRGHVQEDELRRDQGELESLYTADDRLKAEQSKMLDLYAQDLIALDVLQERLASVRKKQEAIAEATAEVQARIDRRKSAAATTDALKEYCKLVREGIARASQCSANNKSGKDYRREFLEMLETSIRVDEKEIHISGIITGKLPLFEAGPDSEEAGRAREEDKASLLYSTNGCGVRGHGPPARGC